MKIEIVNYFASGRELFFWTLYDGPDGIDKVTGYATSLEEALCKILDWRHRISHDYIDSIEPESSSEGVGDSTTE
jgi:hypothetical protein